jgi:hypothetical protein
VTAWRLAKAIPVLQAQVNAAYPHRPKGADGTIGDAAHAARVSDHNPNPPHAGVVTAWDITTDTFSNTLAEQLREMGMRGDGRVKYVIWQRHITSAEHAWKWAPYTGADPHTGHIHLSLSDLEPQYDRLDSWPVLDLAPSVHAHDSHPPLPVQGEEMQIVRAPGKPTALLTSTGRLVALKAGEGEVYLKLGVQATTLTADEFALLDAVSHRVAS